MTVRFICQYTNSVNQVYRSYRGDVSLLTDIVRCAVRFADSKDMLEFVRNWLFVYGEPQRPENKPSMAKRFREQMREFKDVINYFFNPVKQNSGNSDSEHRDNGTPADKARANPDSEHVCCANFHFQGASVHVEPDAAAAAAAKAAAAEAEAAAAKAAAAKAAAISEAQKHKIFEILRIRNRFDPSLVDVPGGYRDFALKIKIGFSR